MKPAHPSSRIQRLFALVLSLALLTGVVPVARAATITVSGTISSNTTWTAGNVYQVTGDVTVPVGVTLTIEPGVVVQVAAGKALLIDGTLIADGTADNRIMFTSTATVKAAGDWDGIYFAITSTGSVLDDCDIQYAGDGHAFLSATRYAAVYVYGSSPVITNNTFTNNYRRAMEIRGGAAPTISGNSVISSGAYLLSTDVDTAGLLNLGANSTAGGTANAVEVYGGALALDASWPDYGVPFVLENDVTVGIDATLTLLPGVVIEVTSANAIIVDGTLLANGLSENPISLTSAEPTPAAGDWVGVYFNNTSTASVLNEVDISFAGGYRSYQGAGRYTAVLAYGSSPTITNNQFSNNDKRAIEVAAAGAPTIYGNTAISSGDYFLSASVTSVPLISLGSNTTTGGTVNAIEVPGGTVALDATWPDHGIPYIVSDDLTVGLDATLTLTPGSTFRFSPTAHHIFKVDGTLIAQGTADFPITFTSAKAIPHSGDWVGLYFTNTSVNSVLSYCTVEYAGLGYSFGGTFRNGGVVVYGSSPQISDCTFRNNYGAGVQAAAGAHPLISGGNVFVGNSKYGVQNTDPAVTVDATHNYWGASSGPYNAATNPSGTGDAVSDHVDYRPYLGFGPEQPYRLSLPTLIKLK